MSQLGLTPKDFVDAKGRVKSLADNFAVLRKATAGMSESEKFNVFHMFFGTTGQESALILNKNVDALKKLNKQVDNSQNMNHGKGYIASLSEKNMNTFKKQFDRVKSELTNSGIDIANEWLPSITKITTSVADLLEKFNNLPGSVKKTTGALIGIGVAVGPLSLVLGTIIKMRGTLQAGYSLLTKMGTVGGVLGDGKGVFKKTPKPTTPTVSGTFDEVSNAAQGLSGIGEVEGKHFAKNATEGFDKTTTDSARKFNYKLKSGSIDTSKKMGSFIENSAVSGGTKFSSVIKGLGWAGIGLTVGQSIFTGKTVQDKLNGAGEGFGAAAGLALTGGNPFGAILGAQVGKAILSKNTLDALRNPKAQYSNEHNQEAKRTAQRNKLRQKYYSQGTSDSDDANTVLNQISAKSLSSNNTHKIFDEGFDALTVKNPSDIRKNKAITTLKSGDKGFVNSVLKSEEQANEAWANSAGKSSKQVRSAYNSIFNLAQGQSNKELTSEKKKYDYLVKMHLLDANTAQQAYSDEKDSNNKRLNSLKNTIAEINSNDKLSNSQRTKAIAKINSQIVGLTDSGAKKQRQLLKNVFNRSTSLTVAGYAKILTSSKNNEQKTIANAKKLESKQDGIAKDNYKRAVSYANSTKRLSADQRKVIISNARKQYKDSVDKARQQKKETVAQAESQRKQVVAAAKKEAGEAAAAFDTSAQNLAVSIPALLQFNSKSGLGTHSGKKFHSGDLTSDKSSGLQAQNTRVQAFKSKTLGLSGSKNKKNSIKIQTGFASGGVIKHNQIAAVNEAGLEIAYNPRTGKFRTLGNGPAFAKLNAGEHVINARDTAKMLNGGLGAGRTLKGYAKGTTKLNVKKNVGQHNSIKVSFGNNSLKTTEKKTKQSMAVISSSITGGYNQSIPKATKSVKRFTNANADAWKSSAKDTTKYANKMANSTNSFAKKMSSGNSKYTIKMADIANDQTSKMANVVNKNTKKEANDAISNANYMQKGVQKQHDQMHDGIIDTANNTVSGFGKAFGKMDNYAHSAMSNTISQLNSGIKGIDTTLSKFGGGGAVIPTIHYANGTNGPIKKAHMAVVNDAKSGPKQEAILRGNRALLPKGNDVVFPMKPGDEVLNGREVADLKDKGMLPHYAKGTGALKRLIKNSNNNPNKQWNSEFPKTKPAKTDFGQALNTVGRQATNSVGQKWNSEVWSQMNDAMSGGGSAAGGNWTHNPGGWSHTDVFGSPRSGGVHDGNDFSSHQGAVIHAVHGGKVIRAAMPPGGWGPVGYSIITKGDDGQYVMYQEFGTAKNAKVGVGDVVKTGQSIATLGNSGLGTGPHVHIGVSKNYPFNNNGMSTSGWEDLMRMHGHSDGSSKLSGKKKQSKNPALTKLVKSQIGGQLKWVSKHLADSEDAGGSMGNPSGASVNRWRPFVVKALKANHFAANTSQVEAWMRVIKRESNGDPRAINNWDSNAKAGIPSKGLVQTIGPTFESNKFPGHGNIYNGYDDLLAGIHYAAKAYGRGPSMFARVSGPLGYAKGGRPTVGQDVIVGEHGPELARFDQPATIYDNKKTTGMISKPKGKAGRKDININVNVNVKGNTGDTNSTSNQIAKQVGDILLNMLRNEQDNLSYD